MTTEKPAHRNKSKHTAFTIEAVRYVMRRYQMLTAKGPYAIISDIEDILPSEEFPRIYENSEGFGPRVLPFDRFKTFLNLRSTTPDDEGKFIDCLIEFIKRQTVIPEHYKLLNWPATHNLFADSLVKLSAGENPELHYLENIQKIAEKFTSIQVSALRNQSDFLAILLIRGIIGEQFVQVRLIAYGMAGVLENRPQNFGKKSKKQKLLEDTENLCKTEVFNKLPCVLDWHGIIVPCLEGSNYNLNSDIKERSGQGTGYFFTESRDKLAVKIGYNFFKTSKSDENTEDAKIDLQIIYPLRFHDLGVNGFFTSFNPNENHAFGRACLYLSEQHITGSEFEDFFDKSFMKEVL